MERLARLGPWDAVVDTGAYAPADVALTTEALADAVGIYVVVSTVSAYRDWPALPVTEDSALWPARPDTRESDPEVARLPGPFAYGTLKAACELTVRHAVGDRALVLRPGVVLGRYEYVGRLESLLRRAAVGGRMLAAGDPSRPIQPIDVRDLAVFTLDLIAGETTGTFNVVAPPGHATYGDLIRACVDVTGAGAEPVWVEPEWLVERGVAEWTEMPLWRSAPGTWAVDGQRAQSAGLTCRPLTDTVADTWAMLQRERPVAHPRAGEHGLDPSREVELLAAWDAASTGRRG